MVVWVSGLRIVMCSPGSFGVVFEVVQRSRQVVLVFGLRLGYFALAVLVLGLRSARL